MWSLKNKRKEENQAFLNQAYQNRAKQRNKRKRLKNRYNHNHR